MKNNISINTNKNLKKNYYQPTRIFFINVSGNSTLILLGLIWLLSVKPCNLNDASSNPAVLQWGCSFVYVSTLKIPGCTMHWGTVMGQNYKNLYCMLWVFFIHSVLLTVTVFIYIPDCLIFATFMTYMYIAEFEERFLEPIELIFLSKLEKSSISTHIKLVYRNFPSVYI